MPRSLVLSADTVLYSAAEPQGRTFPAGETWPGDAWSERPGGAAVGAETVTQAAKDLATAQGRIEAQASQLETASFSLAERSAERDAAVGKVDALEQRAIAAEKAQADAEEAARNYMVERDAARTDAKRFSDLVDGYRPEAEKVAGLVEQLNAANQAVADLNDQLAAAQAAAKPKKAAKGDDAAAEGDPEPADAT